MSFPSPARRLLMAVAGLVISGSSHAWDGVVTGRISRIDGVAGVAGAPGNFDLRVFIENQPSVCSGTADTSWAYINSNDVNYKGIMAIVLLAQVQGKPITMYSVKSSSGYCQIGYVVVPT